MSNLLPNQVLLNALDSETRYFQENLDSKVKAFTECLRELGFIFYISDQVKQFMPKYKDIILPLAIQYYNQADQQNERDYFITLMRYPCCKKVVPTLLNSFYANTEIDNRERIAECIYAIHDKKYMNDYIKIIQTPEFGKHRALFILLLGRWKVEEAVDCIISLLHDDQVKQYAISALGDYRKEEYAVYLTEFLSSGDPYLKRYAKRALEKCQKCQGDG